VSTYRIIERGGEFYVQHRVLFFWMMVEEELGWNCSAPKPHASMEAARQYIDELALRNVTVQCGG
jgi:hypothetical protein